MNNKICIVYTHHKLGDLIWQLPYIKAISKHHDKSVDLILRKKTQAQHILKDLDHVNKIYYNNFRKKFFIGLMYLSFLKYSPMKIMNMFIYLIKLTNQQ